MPRQDDFHSLPAHVPKGLLCYRAGQEDSRPWALAGLLAAAGCSADLRANCQGTGFVVTEGADHRIILELSALVGGPVASLPSEGVGLLSILQKVEEHYKGHVQLMIFIDCLALLTILSKWGQSDFGPDPGDVVHFDVIFPLIKKLRGWSQKVTLIKVKSHAGCFLNEMADEHAKKGCSNIPGAEQIWRIPTVH